MEASKPRLNPFLFSPDTNFRFILLIVSIVGASLFAYDSLYLQLNQQRLLTVWAKCSADADAVYPLDGLDPAAYLRQLDLHSRFINDCSEPSEQSESQWILIGLALLLLIAGAIYWFMPAARIRRDKLIVLSPEDDPEMMAYLLELSHRAGLKRPPVFLLRALNSSPSGLAFGHLGQYYVVLNGGLAVLFHQDPNRFNAIVLHELSHLRNRDVDKTYFSLAIGLSFLLVTLIPLTIGNIRSLISNFTGNISSVLWQIFSASIYVPFIYIALASILRSREAYADARVTLLDESSSQLRNELSSLSSSQTHPLWQFFGLHPNPAWRLRVFDEPSLLFGLSHWDAFLVGILSTFALQELDNFFSTWFPPSYESYSMLGASLFFIPIVASVVGIGVWQKVFANQIHDRVLSGFGRYGLSLGTGMLIGMTISFSSFVEASSAFANSSVFGTLAFNIFVGILLLISLFLIFRWVAMGAAVWLETVTTPRDVRGMTVFGLLTTGVMMSFWAVGFYLLIKFGYEFVFRFALIFVPVLQRQSEFEGLGLSLYTESVVASITLLTILFNTPMLLFIAVWLFPLLSKLRKSRTIIQNVFVREKQALNLPAKTHPQLRPFSALLAGLLVAFGFLFLITMLRVWLHFTVDLNTRLTSQWIFNFRIFLIGLAIVVQVMLAVFLSATMKAFGWAHGLFAAFIAGLLLSIGFAILPEIGDCISILRLGNPSSCVNFLEMNLALWVSPILVLGWAFSLLPAFVASWAGSFVRSLISRPSPS